MENRSINSRTSRCITLNDKYKSVKSSLLHHLPRFKFHVESFSLSLSLMTMLENFQLFIRTTQARNFYASSFSRNWREIVEHQALPRNRNVLQLDVDVSTDVTQHGLEHNVSYFSPVLSFSFYSVKNRDLALASISIVSLLSERHGRNK